MNRFPLSLPYLSIIKRHMSCCRSQVSQLTELLDREHRMRRAQDEALDSLRSSAEEITLLEAEEIARLESELEVSHIISMFI